MIIEKYTDGKNWDNVELQLLPRPPTQLLCAPQRQDDNDAMHEECGFVMFCAFSVIFKKQKQTKTILAPEGLL